MSTTQGPHFQPGLQWACLLPLNLNSLFFLWNPPVPSIPVLSPLSSSLFYAPMLFHSELTENILRKFLVGYWLHTRRWVPLPVPWLSSIYYPLLGQDSLTFLLLLMGYPQTCLWPLFFLTPGFLCRCIHGSLSLGSCCDRSHHSQLWHSPLCPTCGTWWPGTCTTKEIRLRSFPCFQEPFVIPWLKCLCL